MAAIIDGKAEAARLRAEVAEGVLALKAVRETAPGLAVILVGEDPASAVYVRTKGRATREAGMASFERRLPADVSEAALLEEIARLNADPAVHGILCQLPLPPQIDPLRVIEAIAPEKDVDGFHPLNVGRLTSGRPTLVPCTPLGCLRLIEGVRPDLRGARALVLGRSNIVGKPMASLLLGRDCTVTLAHSRTRDLPALAREADVLVAAVGRPGMVTGDWVKPGAVVIDVGINRVPAPERGEGATRLAGDVEFESAAAVAGAITPVPGGVGPMTVACLLANTLMAAKAQLGVRD